MDKVHEDLIDAWETEAMYLSQECSLAWSDLENDPDNDRLPAYNAARGKLRAHLKMRPGHAPTPAHRCPACDSAETSDRHEWMCNECGEYFEVTP